MIYPDSHTARALGRYRQASYEHEADVERLVRPMLERRRRRTTALVLLRLRLRAVHAWRQASR